MMGKNKSYDKTDESEVFKHKSLTAAKNRKKFSKIMQWALYIMAILIAAACVFAYFFRRHLTPLRERPHRHKILRGRN